MTGRSEATEGLNKKMKITGLTIVCLEEIFEYLDLENLVNVADSNKRLNIAACFVFQRKYGKKKIVLEILELSLDTLYVEDERINVIGANNILKFLRCFGCLTSEPMIFLGISSQKQMDSLCFHINEYCAESLIKLVINGYTSAIIFPHLKRPFVNIETLIFRRCYLGTNVMQFNKWFPKMRHLELYGNQMVERECIEMNFPNLTHLTYRPKYSDKDHFTPHFENVIRLNPNLRSLCMHNWSAHIFPNISKYLPQFEVLTIETLPGTEPDDIGQVHFKNVKKFEICDKWKRSDFLSKIDFTFDQLEEFHGTEIKLNNLLTFVKKYPTIKKLRLNYSDGKVLSEENVLQVAKALPLLSELKLNLRHTFSVDEIIYFVDELKQVKKFHFILVDRSKVDDLRAKLGSEWKVSIDQRFIWGNFIILQRK